MPARKSTEPQPLPTPEPSQQEKLAMDQAAALKWSQVAAHPSLSPEAATVAANLSRSYKAAVRLGTKALAYQDQDQDQDPLLNQALGNSPQDPPTSSENPTPT
jgi:hypothetical protein